MEQLRYVIAGLGLTIHSQNSEKIKSSFASFLPFYVNEFPKRTVHLFDFFTGLTLDIKGEKIYSFDWEGTRCDIYMTESHYCVRFFITEIESYIIRADKEWKVINSDIKEINDRTLNCLSFFIMFGYCFASVPHNTLLIHASVVVYNDKAMVFQGKSGTGKSTHSRLWLENIKDTHLLNDDNPVVIIDDSGILNVYGSPWSGKTPCYINKHYEIAGFVRLSQANENKLTKLSLSKSFASILPSTRNMVWDKRVHENLCNTI